MLIGIMLSAQRPDAGGGFTLEQQVIRALLDDVDSWPHEWLFMGHEATSPISLPSSKRCSYLSLGSGRAGAGFARRLRDLGDRGLRVVRRAKDVPSNEAAAFLRRGGQLQWSLVPGSPLLPDVPVAQTVWDLQHRLQPIFPEVRAGGEWARREHAYARTLGQATCVIVGTERGREEVHDFYRIPVERIHVVPFPTPVLPSTDPLEDEATLRSYGVSRGYLYYPAQFWAHKNHITLLLALRKLHDLGRPLHVVFSGSDKGVQGFIQDEALRLGLREHSHFVGFLPARHLPAFYRRAVALCFPSFFGPDNLPPLEALSLGCPAIVADVPGAAEQLGDAVLRFDPTDPGALAQAIVRVVDGESVRVALQERGAIRAVAWTPRDYVAAACAIFDKLEAYRRCWGTGPTAS